MNSELKVRTRKTQERRAHIIRAAASCFVQKGFHQTSIRDIANQANISVGNLYNHFDSKHRLIAEIATLERHEIVEFCKALAHATDPKAAVIAFIKNYIDFNSQPHNAILTAEIAAEAMRQPEIAKGYQINRQELIVALAKNLEKTGPAEVPAPIIAETILDACEGLAIRCVMAQREPKDAELQSIIQIGLV